MDRIRLVLGVMCVAFGCQDSPRARDPHADGAAVSDGAVPEGAVSDGAVSDGAVSDGAAGHDGPTTSIDGPAPTPVTCNPGEQFCSGNHLWSCTLSGHDATHFEDCGAAGTATNPATCVTSGCAAGNQACCKRQAEPCTYSITSPAPMAGTCNPPQAALNLNCGSLTALAAASPAPAPTVCSSDAFEVLVEIDRTKHTAGTSFPVGNGDTVFYSSITMGLVATCSSWTGNVQWISDIPSWRIDVDLTCTTGSIHFVGTFHGIL